MTKVARIYNKEKTVYSISGAGKTGQLHVKEWNIWNIEYSVTSYTKINSKWIKDLNVRPDTIKLLEENIGRTLSDINHSKILFDPPPRVMKIKTKINKWGLPGDPVVKTLHSQCRGPGFDPWSGNWILHDAAKSPHAATKRSCMLQLKILHAATKDLACGNKDPTCQN